MPSINTYKARKYIIASEVINEFKVFTVVSAEFNTYTKKELLKVFNLFGEKNKRTSPF